DAAMDRELRPFVAGFQSARFAPDRLAALGEVSEFPRTDAGGIEAVVQAKLDQLAHGMRQHIDADAERLQLAHALEHARGNANLGQAERQRQPANAAAWDENGHDAPSLLGMVMTRDYASGQPRKRRFGRVDGMNTSR